MLYYGFSMEQNLFNQDWPRKTSSNRNKNKVTMYTFIDNWYGDSFSFPTLRAAKKEAKNHTCGHSIAIYHNGDIVAIVKPNERPLP